MIDGSSGAFAGFRTLVHAAFRSLHRHPKRLSAALATLLLGAGGGAFAVAEFGADASDVQQREVLHDVQAPALADAVAALDAPGAAFNLYRSDTTRGSDTAEALLQRLGVVDSAAAAFLRTDPVARNALLGRAGRSVTAETTREHGLRKLVARWATDDTATFQRLVVVKTAGGFSARVDAAPLVATSRLASGTIRSSLFAATDDARLPDTVATQVAEMFASDIDFRRELRRGDRFSVVYETLEADGEPLRAGRVLSAEFVNAGKPYQAIWFQGHNASKGAYYTLEGQSLRKAYLASPVEFSRMTSGFAMRMHPILQQWKAHLGVDFAAPTGTAVRTVGDGTVSFAGVQNGFGNVVFVKHRNGHETVYAHLSRIGVRVGQSVSQGETVGAVGATGWATGPHLHFEFRVNGTHQNPLTMAKQSEAVPIAAAERAQFERLAATVRVQLAAASAADSTVAVAE